jgi:hypothetical protein
MSHIPIIKSRAQAHLIGGVITGNTTVPGVTPDDARAALTGLAVNSLPDYVDTPLSFTPTMPSSGSGGGSGGGLLAAAGAIALSTRHTVPASQQPTEKTNEDGRSGMVVPKPHPRHLPTQNTRPSRIYTQGGTSNHAR